MLKLIKNGEIYDPRYIGKGDVLLCGDKVALIEQHIEPFSSPLALEVIDAAGMKVVPGFIDQHVHFTGGGGEGGPVTRTPEIMLSDLTSAGVTTALGLLGTDGITRSPEALLSKARALEEEGITTYIYTGSYNYPFRTISGSTRSDIVLIDKIIGSGEVALSDHRSSQPTLEDLKKLAAETRVGGILSGKCGIVHLHMGDGPAGLTPLLDLIRTTEIPAKQFMPTHINRNVRLVEQSLELLKLGGYVDLTSDISKSEKTPHAMNIADTLKFYVESNAPLDHVCASSDGNGSLPVFDAHDELLSIGVGSPSSLFRDIREGVIHDIVSLEQALGLLTANPAKALKLYPRKGTLRNGSDADLVLLDKTLAIHTVIAKGNILVKDRTPIRKGFFEK